MGERAMRNRYNKPLGFLNCLRAKKLSGYLAMSAKKILRGLFSSSQRICNSQGRFAWRPNSRPRLIFHIRLSCRCAGRAVSQPRSVNSCVRFKIVFLSRKEVGADLWISRRETIGWAQWTTSHFKSCAVASLRTVSTAAPLPRMLERLSDPPSLGTGRFG